MRERFACRGCNDTFPVDDSCPRCDLPLDDTWHAWRTSCRAQPAAPPPDPRIDALIAALEAGPRWVAPTVPIPPAARPWLACALFVFFGLFTTQVGLTGLGVMLAAFGLLIATLEMHDRVTRPEWMRALTT